MKKILKRVIPVAFTALIVAGAIGYGCTHKAIILHDDYIYIGAMLDGHSCETSDPEKIKRIINYINKKYKRELSTYHITNKTPDSFIIMKRSDGTTDHLDFFGPYMQYNHGTQYAVWYDITMSDLRKIFD